jgi:hypothetical protein
MIKSLDWTKKIKRGKVYSDMPVMPLPVPDNAPPFRATPLPIPNDAISPRAIPIPLALLPDESKRIPYPRYINPWLPERKILVNRSQYLNNLFEQMLRSLMDKRVYKP